MKLLFSLDKKDFEMQTFRSGGKGGQNQNKRNTGVRLIHHMSGARGESREERSQEQNKKNAFVRLVNSEIFKKWHKAECARRLGTLKSLDQIVDEQMRPENLRIEEF
jgi:protein subunit release factor B